MQNTMDNRFDEMSRDELINFIGGNVDHDMSRSELISMAKEKISRNEQM